MKRTLVRRVNPHAATKLTNHAAFSPLCFDVRKFKPHAVTVGRRQWVGYAGSSYAIAVPANLAELLPSKLDLYVLLCMMRPAFFSNGVVVFKSWRSMARQLGLAEKGATVRRLELSLFKWATVWVKANGRAVSGGVLQVEVSTAGEIKVEISKGWLKLHSEGYWTSVSPSVVRALGSELAVNFYLYLKATSEVQPVSSPFKRNVRKLYEKLTGKKAPAWWRAKTFLESMSKAVKADYLCWTYTKKSGDVFEFAVLK